MKWLGTKLIQGLTCAMAGAASAGLLCQVTGITYGIPGMLLVGVPALLGGLLLFPVSKRVVDHRARFTAQGAKLGLVCSASHHVYYVGFTALAVAGQCTGASCGSWFSLDLVLALPSLLMHPSWIARGYASVPNDVFVFESIGVGIAACCAFALQPQLARLIKEGARVA